MKKEIKKFPSIFAHLVVKVLTEKFDLTEIEESHKKWIENRCSKLSDLPEDLGHSEAQFKAKVEWLQKYIGES